MGEEIKAMDRRTRSTVSTAARIRSLRFSVIAWELYLPVDGDAEFHEDERHRRQEEDGSAAAGRGPFGTGQGLQFGGGPEQATSGVARQAVQHIAVDAERAVLRSTGGARRRSRPAPTDDDASLQRLMIRPLP